MICLPLASRGEAGLVGPTEPYRCCGLSPRSQLLSTTPELTASLALVLPLSMSEESFQYTALNRTLISLSPGPSPLSIIADRLPRLSSATVLPASDFLVGCSSCPFNAYYLLVYAPDCMSR